MVCVATTCVIIYWKSDQIYYPYIAHYARFDEYNSRLSIEDNHKPGSLLLQQYQTGFIQNPNKLNLTLCEIDISSIQFGY